MSEQNGLPPCPDCGAPAGKDCRTVQGRIPPHESRLQSVASTHGLADDPPENWFGSRTYLATLAQARASGFKAGQEAMRERAAKEAREFGEPYVLHTNTGAMMFRACVDKIAEAILALPIEEKGE